MPRPPDLPSDQRLEDGGALVFDTDALEADFDLLGDTVLELDISADRPVAQVAARLSDVDPDDRATRVTFGIRNLTHRDGHEAPQPLEPGRRYRIRMRLNEIAHRFRRGHRIRLAISSSYWPLAWPAPEPARLALRLEGCRLHLPERRGPPDSPAPRDLGAPRQAPTPEHTLLAPAHREWKVEHNLATNEVALSVINNDPVLHLHDNDLVFGREVQERYSYRSDSYDTVRGEVVHTRHFRRAEDWSVRTVTRTVLTSTRDAFLIRATLDAYDGDVRVFAKSWDETVPRDCL